MLVAIIRVYDHHTDAADAVQELRKAGVPEHDISVLTRDDRVTGAAKGAEIGAALGGLAGLLTGLGLVAIPGIGPVMATGWLAATAAGAAAGGLAGGAIGVVSQAGVSGEEAHTIAECLRRRKKCSVSARFMSERIDYRGYRLEVGPVGRPDVRPERPYDGEQGCAAAGQNLALERRRRSRMVIGHQRGPS